ncbi:sulfotransferase family 2 domain-containing protein [Peribacillus sp. AS_1]|nr:sulfotransferase family 2 domain-containing protein [Peribacillus sp. AS_2]MCZ0874844.1 sulfotransferase family 2 domain-containing protein [Peribacillus sp. AS_2]
MFNKNEVLDKMLKYRVPYFNEEFPLILFWSQKSGCTSFAKWFFFQIGLLDEAIQYNPWIHLYEEEVYKNQPNYKKELVKSLLISKKNTFKLVRDPYKRAVSQFLILATTQGLVQWEKEWEKIREYFYNDKKSKKGISFKQFLYYIKDYDSIDDHFTPQYIQGEEIFVKNYIYLETFEAHISEIEKKYGLKKSNLNLITKSTHHLTSSMLLNGNYSDMEITNETFIRERKFPTYKSFYDVEATNLVNFIFHKDFEVYGYKKTGKV